MKRFLIKALMKYKFALSLAVFAVAIGFIGDHCLVRRYAQRQEIAQLRSEINDRINTYNKDKQELERIKTNPEAVKRVAREKYYMKMEDEDIFIIGDDE